MCALVRTITVKFSIVSTLYMDLFVTPCPWAQTLKTDSGKPQLQLEKDFRVVIGLNIAFFFSIQPIMKVVPSLDQTSPLAMDL